MKNKIYKSIILFVLAIILGVAGLLYHQSRPIDKMEKMENLDVAHSWFPVLSSNIIDFYQEEKNDVTGSDINKKLANYLVSLYKVDKTLSIPTLEKPTGDFFYIYFLLPPELKTNAAEQIIAYTNSLTTPRIRNATRCVIFLKNGTPRSTLIDESTFRKICPADVESKKPDLMYRDERYEKVWEKLRKEGYNQ